MTDLSAEDARIARHLAGAEAQLRACNVDHLPAPVRTVRAFVIESLRAYRLAGRFPRNLVRSERTPVFIDSFGTRCAMAHLLELVGAHALVERVAREGNLARIRQLASDPELLRWLAAMGLTVDEAARIQPSYCEISRADCWCAGGNAEAVVLATSLGKTDVFETFRVDEVLAGTLVSVGAEISIATYRVSAGQQVLALRRKGDAGELFGWISPLPRMPVSDGNCDIAAVTLTPSRDVLVDALMSKQCSNVLVQHDARFAVNSCNADPEARPDSGVAASGNDAGSSGCSWAVPAPSELGLVIAVSILFARRMRRSS